MTFIQGFKVDAHAHDNYELHVANCGLYAHAGIARFVTLKRQNTLSQHDIASTYIADFSHYKDMRLSLARRLRPCYAHVVTIWRQLCARRTH